MLHKNISRKGGVDKGGVDSMNWKQKRIMVTGGHGFIGSHLVEHLMDDKGATVYVADDDSRGHNNLHHVHYDIDLRKQQPPIYAGDIVFHLAAKVTGIAYNATHQLNMLQHNLAINYTVAEAVKKAKPSLYVYVSTACVYPHDAPVPTPESAGRVGNPEPTNFGYGVAKWVGEQQARYIHYEYNIPTIIVRFFNAFGPRDYYDYDTSHVAPALIRRVMELHEREPLVVWGSGLQSRALVDARDIAKALVMLAETPEAHDAQPINIGHAQEVTMNALASMIMNLCGKSADIENDTSKPDGYPRRAADTTRLQSLIGWIPDRPIVETLGDMIDEYRAGKANL